MRKKNISKCLFPAEAGGGDVVSSPGVAILVRTHRA